MPKINLESTEALERAIMHILHNRRKAGKVIIDVLDEKLPTAAFNLMPIYQKEIVKATKDMRNALAKIKN